MCLCKHSQGEHLLLPINAFILLEVSPPEKRSSAFMKSPITPQTSPTVSVGIGPCTFCFFWFLLNMLQLHTRVITKEYISLIPCLLF